MSTTLAAVFGLVGLQLLCVLLVVSRRGLAILTAGRAINSFAPDGDDLTPAVQRVTRLYANLYENMAMLLAFPLLAIATDQTAVTDPLAPWLLGARVVQAGVHAISTSSAAVSIRFTAYLAQLLVVAWWGWRLAGM